MIRNQIKNLAHEESVIKLSQSELQPYAGIKNYLPMKI